MARVLYLSHDGLMEPLSQSQVWQYLGKLARNHEVTLVTFEKKGRIKLIRLTKRGTEVADSISAIKQTVS